MSQTPTLNGQVLGQAENALQAVLRRLLAQSGTTFQQWVGLNFTAISGGSVDRSQFIGRMTDGLKVDDAVASATIGELTSAGLLEELTPDGSRLGLTAGGQARYLEIRAGVDTVTARLYAGIPADDLAVAGRVLTVLTERANTELASAAR